MALGALLLMALLGPGADARFEALARAQGGPLGLGPAETRPLPVPEVAPEPVLDIETARRVIRSERASLWACREWTLDRDDYVLELAIRSNGRVWDLRVRATRNAHPKLQDCFRRAVVRWRFPRFSGERDDGRTVEITNLSVPITFEE